MKIISQNKTSNIRGLIHKKEVWSATGVTIEKNKKDESFSLRAKIVINDSNFSSLYRILCSLVSKGINKVDLIISFANTKSVKVEEMAQRFSSMRYCFLDKLIIRARNIPYCLIKQPEGVIYFSGKADNFIKPAQCQLCKYNLRCKGVKKEYIKIFDLNKIKPIPDLPREVMIEIEARCNLDCEFCFNKNSFAEKGRDIKNKLSTSIIKKIIDSTAQTKIPIVRFTGGEPLLRKDIWQLAKYAKRKNLETRLNTNGILITSLNIAKEIAQHFDNVLMPIQYSDVLGGDKVARTKNKAIKYLKQAEVKILRVGTVATKTVIKNLDQVHKFVISLPIDKWELYRAIAVPGNPQSFTRTDVKNLIEGLIKIRKATGKIHYLINAIPFCSYDPIKIQTVAAGAGAVDGHERLAVDPRGFAKPIYYMRENIGDPTDILACWNHSFMKKMRNLEFVPRECKKCVYLERCRGGCRFSAYTVNGSFKAPDPLMSAQNIIYQ